MNKTKIPWATHTWNPITGCLAISEGCENCYAKALSHRFGWDWGTPQFHPERLRDPLKRKKPAKIFVCSMSDLFHEKVEDSWVNEVIRIIQKCPQHTFMILTKRPKRMKEYFDRLFSARCIPAGKYIHDNLWLGVTVENQKRADERIPILLDIPAKVRFVSSEPLLEKINIEKYLGECVSYCHECKDIVIPNYIHSPTDNEIDEVCGVCKSEFLDDLPGIDWIIVGGETGAGARYCAPDWIMKLEDQCHKNTFFFKQWGTSAETKRELKVMNDIGYKRERIKEIEEERNFPEADND